MRGDGLVGLNTASGSAGRFGFVLPVAGHSKPEVVFVSDLGVAMPVVPGCSDQLILVRVSRVIRTLLSSGRVFGGQKWGGVTGV